MKTIVQKFGGTSVATKEARELVCEKIIKAKEEGNNVVVIVSAMGRSGEPYATDTLLDLIRKNNGKDNRRELDVIYSCGEIISASVIASNLTSKGYKAISLSGQQAGIITNNNHCNAEVNNIETTKIMKYLEDGYITVIAGSQGVSLNGNITTLGRGGSDISAVAIGSALKSDKVLIYTDVEGIMSADPNFVDNTELIEKISYNSCYVLANKGAKVIHPRAVKLAQKHNTKVYVRSTFSNCKGTLISEGSNEEEIHSITKMALGKEQSIICLIGEKISYKTNETVVEYLEKNDICYSNLKTDEKIINFIVDNKDANSTITNLHELIIINKLSKLKKLA